MPVTASEGSRAVQALRQSTHPSLRRLSVEETDAVIVISGRVRSYYLKQLAQEAVRVARGGREIVNHVNVVQE